MNEQQVASTVSVALVLVDAAMKAIPQTAAFEPIAAMLLAAVTNLATVTGSSVTYTQLEGLRVKQS